MKFLFRFVLLLFSALILLCVAMIFFAVSDNPEVQLGWTLTHKDVDRARKILHEGSKTKPDEIGTIELSKEDLNLAANYLLNRYSNSAVNISLKENGLKFTITTTLPENWLGKYLNITFRLGNESGSQIPSITKFKAGKLLVPAGFSSFIINNVIKYTSLHNYFILATTPIKTVIIKPEKITITYFSNLETLVNAENALSNQNTKPDLRLYQQKIADIVTKHDPKWRLSLADLLKPLFELARQRSTLENAIDENRFVIMAVNEYVNKSETRQFFSRDGMVKTHYFPVFLYRRNDLAQHFIASAALTASINAQVAKVVGEEKELSDAKRGSGFSFVDLTADKAGQRFGEIATATPISARKLQSYMSKIKDYRDFIPDPTDLPEKMDEAEFNKRYESVNSPDYQETVKKIDERLDRTPLFRDLDAK
jgi:hypothetical protein